MLHRLWQVKRPGSCIITFPLVFSNFVLHFLPHVGYKSNPSKSRVSNKCHPLISTTLIHVQIELSATLY